MLDTIHPTWEWMASVYILLRDGFAPIEIYLHEDYYIR
jgi:hypothetical protein